MNPREVLRRLEAYSKGRPTSRGSTLHYPLPRKDDLCVAFVRMGGESSPWGVAWSKGKGAQRTLTVPEPRERDLVAGMMSAFAPTVLDHLEDVPGETEPPPPIWLPNPTHVAMLHFIAIAYTFARKGERKRLEALNGLGRAAGWLFSESQRAGQLAALDATEVLRDSYTFPCDDVRQAHLGFLLAWLRTKGSLDARLAAASAAELSSVATTLEPELERKTLQPLVDAYREGKKAGNTVAMSKAAASIDSVLKVELLRRLDLVSQAREVLSEDTRDVNPGVIELKSRAAKQYSSYKWVEGLQAEGEGAFVPSPITDRSSTAAARNYRILEASDRLRLDALVHDDADLLQEVISGGDAFSGKIVGVRDEGEGRVTTPVWVIESRGQGPLRLRDGSSVCVVGLPGRVGEIRSVALSEGDRRIEVEITKLKTLPKKPIPGIKVLEATDRKHIGKKVIMLACGPDPFQMLMLSKAKEKGGPGSWLTHSKAGEATQSEGAEGTE